MHASSRFLGVRAVALSLTLAAMPLMAAASEVADLDAAKTQAVASGKPILIDFSSPT